MEYSRLEEQLIEMYEGVSTPSIDKLLAPYLDKPQYSSRMSNDELERITRSFLATPYAPDEDFLRMFSPLTPKELLIQFD